MKIKINRKKLYSKYMKEVNKISEICEDKSIFSPKEIVEIISYLIENNNDIYDIENQIPTKKYRI